MTYGIKLLPLLVESICLSKSDLFRALVFAILSSMRDEGYFCFKRNVFSTSSPTSSVLSSEIIIFNLLAKLYGILALQALQVVCCLLKLSFLIFLLNYMECCFVYVSDGMMCIKGTVLNR